MDCLLGIDIGTTGTKSALFSVNGDLIDSDYRSYPVAYPRENHAEQDPENWWNSLVGTVNNLVERKRDGDRVTAMSLSTQGGCLVLLDENFRPLYPAVSWLDKRAAEVSHVIRPHVSEEELYRTGGWGNLDALTFPAVVWFREKRPELFARARYCASTIDYLNHRLSGRFSTDCSNLALTELLDLHARDLSDRILDIAGITRENVSDVVPSGTPLGRLRPDSARELGLPEDVVLVSGAHDQYCASIGAGAVNSGGCVLSAGTAWVLLVTSDMLVFDESMVIHPCVHVFDGKYGLLTSVPSGGNSLNWFQSTFRPGEDFESLGREAEKVGAGSDGLLFIPNNVSKSGRGAFLNIDTVHTPGHFTRSVFEGVAMANRIHLETFSARGIPVEKLIMIGGGARSALWPRIVADCANIPLVVPDQREAACAGAAMLAGVGSDRFRTIEEACGTFLAPNRTLINPRPEQAVLYDAAYEKFIEMVDIF